jgi:predicted aspartyl protease
VNIERYVRKKKKKRGFAFGIAVVLLGIAAIVVTWYVQTSHPTEEEKRISETGYDKGGPATKQKARTKPGIQRTRRPQRSARRSVTTPPRTRGAPTTSSSARKAPSERTAEPPPQNAEEQVKAGQKETQLTAREWFEKGRTLDDDSELEMESYQKAIAADPKFAPAYYHLGAILYRRAAYDQAEAEFIKFLQYASEEDRLDYDIYLYYSEEDLQFLLEQGKQASRSQERAGEEVGSEGLPEEAVPEGEAEEAAPEGEAEEVVPESGAEEEVPEPGVEIEEEVQTIVRFTSHNGQILVPVVLNGSVTTNVLLDTGSGMTIISPELARYVGAKVARERTIRLRTIAADVQAVLARLDSIELGDLKRADFPVAVSDLKLGEQRKFDGILGMDFLHNYVIHIDNKNSRILLSPSSGQ